MKKRILILIIILLFTTGCTCEYNLTIDGTNYIEEITLTGENSNETNSFKKDWQIPTDKEEHNMIIGSDSENFSIDSIYKYNLSNNKLTFNHEFTQNKYINSTAVSKCYNKLTVYNYNDTTIISTSPNAKCFEEYPPLTKIQVKIKVDREVINNNADRINGNTYIWNINKSNAKDKSINLVLEQTEDKSSSEQKKDKTSIKSIFDSYAIYIFLIIIAVIVYYGYKWFMNFKEKNNNID